MTVLSDKTLKKMIEQNELIPGGNADRAEYCSYEFTADSILRGGSHKVEKIIQSAVAIKPAQLVWIRTCEKISIPAGMVGLWIQTQTMARKGLLLLNISLIEPGYRGPLSAVFVNFGKKDVIINSNTKIAKVMFLHLDGDATNEVEERDFQDYDESLMDMAADGPETFLQLQSFEQKADDILGTMKKQMKHEVSTLSEQVKVQLKNDLQGDLKWTLFKWGGFTLSGLALGCLIVWLMINSYLPRLSEYSKFDGLARRAAMTQQAETITGLIKEIQSLKTQFSDLKTGDNKQQLHNDTSETTPLPDANNTVPNQ